MSNYCELPICSFLFHFFFFFFHFIWFRTSTENKKNTQTQFFFSGLTFDENPHRPKYYCILNVKTKLLLLALNFLSMNEITIKKYWDRHFDNDNFLFSFSLCPVSKISTEQKKLLIDGICRRQYSKLFTVNRTDLIKKKYNKFSTNTKYI